MKEDDDRSLAEEDRIEKEASDWVAFFDRGLTPREQDAFFEWLAENPRHGEVFAEDQEQWQEFNLLDQWRPQCSKEANPDLLKKAFQVSFWKTKPSLYVAAAILLIGLLTPLLLHLASGNRSKLLAAGDFAVSYERHVLEDGSTVELNAGAQVEVLFTEKERRVKLIAGEAHFSVAKNPERPFIVGAKEAEVRAIGTAFSVRLTSESIEVLVTEGKVSLEEQARNNPVKSTPESTKTYKHTELLAGQRAVQPLINKEFNPEVFTVTVGEIESRLAWKDQILDFDSRSLSEVVNEFNRHNYTQIVIGDEALNDLKVTIALKPDNYKGFVKLLELSAGVVAEETDYGTIILRRR